MGKTSLRASFIAGVLLLLSGAAQAAGLGKLTVLSHLGEPLRAEIDVVAVEKNEVDTLVARLASPDAYIQSNLPYPSAALGLKLEVEQRPTGGPYLKVTSAQPISEPFVDLLVELNWTGGKILRAYTALLDPPAFAAAQPPAPTPEARSISPTPPPAPEPQVETRMGSELQSKMPEPPPAEIAPETPAPAPSAAEPTTRTTKSEKAPAAQADSYGPVKRGDTLSKIAKEYKPNDVTLEQMLVLLYRNNKDAFIGNMNRLKTGKVLSVPDPSEAANISTKAARKEVRMQVADFNAYRERLAGASTEGAGASDQSGQAAAGRVTGPVKDKGAPATGEPKEVLKLSKGETPGTGGKGMQDKVRGLEEEVAARDKTIREANERIAKLEKTVKDMQGLMELKNKSMADAGKAAMPPPPPMPLPKPEAALPASPTITPPMPAPATPAPATPAPATPALPPGMTPTPPIPPAAGPLPPPGAGPLPPPATPSMTPKPPVKPKPKVAVQPPPPEQSLLDQALSEPIYLAAGVGVLALLGFLAYRIIQSRRVNDDDELVAEKKNF